MGYVLACLVVIAKPEFFYFALTGALLMLFANAAGKIGFFNAIKNRGAFSPLLYLLAFSFIGLPPLMGFWGKLFILFSLIKAEYVWLVALMVINSAISVPYYLRLARELGVGWKASLTDFICIATVILIVVTFLPDWFFKGMEVIAQTVSIAI
jgi:NADH:ubiquinone oxidoreductase subunit 2 (subunit N)